MSAKIKSPASRQSTIKTRVKKRRNESTSSTDDDYHVKATFLNTDNEKKKVKDKQKEENPITLDKNMDFNDTLIPLSSPKLIEIHQEHLSDIDKMLRGFDLNYKYGPCIGMSRLDRWERAYCLGLNPPKRIKDILVNNDQQYQLPLYCEAYIII